MNLKTNRPTKTRQIHHRALNFGLAAILLTAAACHVHAQADCSSATVNAHLEWCSRDHGFNEGASCGANALSGVVSNVPALVSQPILGNAWDRTNMMGLTKTAYKQGQHDKAIDAAICCQVHNDGSHSCLAAHRDLVGAWLGK